MKVYIYFFNYLLLYVNLWHLIAGEFQFEPSQPRHEFSAKLHEASLITEAILKSIYKAWQVDKYPNFLKSCFMHRSSWELMKLKFMFEILSAEESKTTKEKSFVISYLGG